MTSCRRRGFVLLTILWVVVAVGTATFGAMLVARQAIAAAVNRIDLIQGSWRAEGCLEIVLAGLEARLWSDTPDTPALLARWNDLPALLATVSRPADCRISLRPAGTVRNVNNIEPAQLLRLLTWAGLSRERRSVFAASLFDWIDADSTPRSDGAEAAWYRSRQRPRPRNGSFRAAEEIALVRGSESIAIDSLFGVDVARISWSHAPIPVLASLPGMSDDAVRVLAAYRRTRRSVDLTVLLSAVTGDVRDSITLHAAEILAMTTTAPDDWTLSATTRGNHSAVEAVRDARVVLADRRLAVLYRGTRP